MANYKILVIQHLLKGNNIAKSGDIVDGSKFINLQESLDGGFIELVDENDDSEDNFLLNEELYKIGKFNKAELLEYATENEIDVDESLTKKEILPIVIAYVSENFQIED